jgi:hypothetical protein
MDQRVANLWFYPISSVGMRDSTSGKRCCGHLKYFLGHLETGAKTNYITKSLTQS